MYNRLRLHPAFTMPVIIKDTSDMILRLLLAAVILCIFFGNAYSQYGNRIYIADTHISPADSHQLFLRFRSSTFLNNKEFFNPYQPGYTLIGFFARPVLEYHFGPDTRIKAGVHLLKYSGLGRFAGNVPLFTFQHRFYPGIDMIFGSLYGTLNHQVIEPLFSFERVFTHQHESGLQFLVDRGFFWADLWIDWERFIFTGDPFQEEFTAGLSSRFRVTQKESSLQLILPLQVLSTHKGGQIDTSGERVQTLVNLATGIHLDIVTESDFLRRIGFRGYIAFFRDLSSVIHYHYDNGNAIYPNLYIENRWFDIGFGYWRGNRFVAPRGEPVFQSISQVDPLMAVDRRELFTSKIIVNRRLVRGIDMGLRFEVYQDLISGDFDHTGGLHIMIDERFFITRLRKK